MNEHLTTEENALIVLSEKEINLIKRLRTIPFGRVVIYLENNNPVRIVRVEGSEKL